MIHVSYTDGVNELSGVSIDMDIRGTSFMDGTGLTDAAITAIALSLEGAAASLCGHPTSLFRITMDESRDLPITL